MEIPVSNSQSSSVIWFWILAILLAGSVSPAQAATPATVALVESIKPLNTARHTGPLNPHKPFISRETLTAEENGAPMDFELALKMHNFGELQGRLARGERISQKEMEARYEPLAADYLAAATWLTNQGFVITGQDRNHILLFARAAIGLIQHALQVSFGRVTFEGKEYTSATSAPSVPETLAPLLVGINGLQPYIRLHQHLIMKPNSLTGTNPPFLPSQIAQADNAASLYSSNVTGNGQSIAIVIDTFPSTSDLVSFWQTYGGME